MRFLFLAWLLFSTGLAVGQKPLFEDDFNDNHNAWQLRSDSNFLVEIRNGRLHLEKFQRNFVARGCQWYNQSIPGFNTANDFTIRLSAALLSSDDVSRVFDLQWGEGKRLAEGRVSSMLYQLSFLLNGRIRLERFEGRWVKLADKMVEPDQLAGFNPSQLNQYELVQTRGVISFRVNGTELFRQPCLPLIGNSIGIQQCLKSAWEIDRLEIGQTDPSLVKD